MSLGRGAALSGLLVLLAACGSCGSPDGERVEVTVPAGAGLGRVTDSLEAQGIIGLGPLFRAYVRLRGDAGNLQAGTYAFRPDHSWRRVVDDLVSGKVVQARLTVPEGLTLDAIIPRIARASRVSPDSVRALLESDSLHSVYGVPGPGFEGYLFPDTYIMAPGTAPERVIGAMVERYRAYWTPERRAKLDSLGMSERELVTFASIVQAEARHLEEMPQIAGVFRNRLDRGYPLQADPTVLYALGGRRERLLYAAIDSVADNPYNTYTQPGLPPGPIGAPGTLALDASLEPADTDAFYFVARPNGEHIFTTTLEAHNRAKEEARREWDTAGAAVGTEGAEVQSGTAAPPTSDTSGGAPP